MKKIISILLTIVLLLAFFAIPASAATNKNEWKKQRGPGKIEFNEQGIKCVLDEGLTFFKYTKEMIDVKNFTCTFIPEYERKIGTYFAITLNSSKSYSGPGSYGLFILLRFVQDGVVNVEGQILHVDYYLTEPTRNMDIAVDTTKPLTINGKDNGNGTYTISFEGGTGEYTFDIPENYQFTEDYNGQGYFSFGGTMSESDKRAMTVVSVNGIDFSGNKPEPESTSKPTSSSTSTSSVPTTDDGLIIGGDNTTADTTDNITTDGQEETSSNSTLIIVIIVCGLLILAVVATTVVIVIKKKKPAELQEEIDE